MCSKLKEFLDDGKTRGKTEGQANTIIELLKGRFGGVSTELKQKIIESSKEKLDILTENFFHLENESEILRILS